VPFLPRDPDPGWKEIRIRDGKKSGSGIRDEHPRNLETYKQFLGLEILKFFADPDPGSGIFFTLDPEWKNSDRG